MSTTESRNKELVRRFVDEVFNDQRLDRIDTYLRSDYIEHTPAAPEDIEGREAVREYYDRTFGAFPDFEVQIQDLVAEGHKVVQRSLQGGTHEGEFMDLPPSGQTVQIPGIVIYRFQDGKIAEAWVQADMLGMMQQIGAMEGPEA